MPKQNLTDFGGSTLHYAVVTNDIYKKIQELGYGDDFLTLAFHQGKVMTSEEFNQFQKEGKGQNHHIEEVELYDNCWDICPECEEEVMLKTRFEIQTCPLCGRPIVPCTLCAGHCQNPCPLTKR